MRFRKSYLVVKTEFLKIDKIKPTSYPTILILSESKLISICDCLINIIIQLCFLVKKSKYLIDNLEDILWFENNEVDISFLC